ncbi:fic family toxin-antitoxin system, toxin component [Streptomyces sp. NPDC060194]|uniref:fic family toxin-antitoxin system, toxin component n=1 Tax=Streptomyces sp. NPDC060194 TaxID=3347069 RepID=UPI00364AAEB0
MTGSDPHPFHPLTVPFLLHAAESVKGDPQVDDLGPLYAAVGRVNARAMDTDIYGSMHLKTAALLETLIRLPCLEHSNPTFAWYAALAYLRLHGFELRPRPKAAATLIRDVASGAVRVGAVARQLREWPLADT